MLWYWIEEYNTKHNITIIFLNPISNQQNIICTAKRLTACAVFSECAQSRWERCLCHSAFVNKNSTWKPWVLAVGNKTGPLWLHSMVIKECEGWEFSSDHGPQARVGCFSVVPGTHHSYFQLLHSRRETAFSTVSNTDLCCLSLSIVMSDFTKPLEWYNFL